MGLAKKHMAVMEKIGKEFQSENGESFEPGERGFFAVLRDGPEYGFVMGGSKVRILSSVVDALANAIASMIDGKGMLELVDATCAEIKRKAIEIRLKNMVRGEAEAKAETGAGAAEDALAEEIRQTSGEE